MAKLKPFLITFAVAAVAIAIIFRVPAARRAFAGI